MTPWLSNIAGQKLFLTKFPYSVVKDMVSVPLHLQPIQTANSWPGLATGRDMDVKIHKFSAKMVPQGRGGERRRTEDNTESPGRAFTSS